MAQWQHGGGSPMDGLLQHRVRRPRWTRAASAPLRPHGRSPWNGYANSMPGARSTSAPSPVQAGLARRPLGHWSCSTASSRFCRHRASTDTANSARRCRQLLAGNFRGDTERPDMAEIGPEGI